jgi:hypothetical protein
VARFIGIGVGEYDRGHARLDHAVDDVRQVASRLAESFDTLVVTSPDEAKARAALREVRGTMPDGGSLILMWSGHAVDSVADGPRLLARDSDGGYATDGLGITGDVVGPCADSGASQLLLIVDTCFSGGVMPAADVAARVLQQAALQGQHVWVGVLTSCLSQETARDGLFGERLIRLLTDGPSEPYPRELLVQRWSAHSRYIRGDDLCDTLLKTWDSPAQQPDFQGRGSALAMFPNPRYDPGAPERVVEHLLRAARGGDDDRSWFTGRVAEVNQVISWVLSGEPGIHVITGSAGSGKTAIAGRVVSLSSPSERSRLGVSPATLRHADPGERSVHAHLHARGLTADRAAELIAGQLVRSGHLAAQDDKRNAAELIGHLQRAVECGGAPPVIVVDGLDEARDHAFEIAEDLLLRLQRYATIIVATRELRRGDEQPPLLAVLTTLAAGQPTLDLDAADVRERGRADLGSYVRDRLAGVSQLMDAVLVADYLAAGAGTSGDESFLLARLVTDQLRTTPVDTSADGWESGVSHSVGDAFEAAGEFLVPGIRPGAADCPHLGPGLGLPRGGVARLRESPRRGLVQPGRHHTAAGRPGPLHRPGRGGRRGGLPAGPSDHCRLCPSALCSIT